MNKNLRRVELTENEKKINKGVYRIYCKISGKSYIGSSSNIRKRFIRHKNDLASKSHHSNTLQMEWIKYGNDEFTFEIIEEIYEQKNLLEKEQYWIDFYETFKYGYNISPTAGSCKGIKQSKEFIEKRIYPLRGRKRSEEEKLKIKIGILKAFQRPEVKEKLEKNRLYNIGRKLKLTDEKRLKMSLLRKGRKPSLLTREKMSIAQKKVKKLSPIKNNILDLLSKGINIKKGEGTVENISKKLGCSSQYFNKVLRENGCINV